MDAHYLKLNNDKTEVLVVHRPSPHAQCSVPSSLHICGYDAIPSANVRNLGVNFDECFGLEQHVNNIGRVAFKYLENSTLPL
jgi:hypothetical protein